MEKQQPTFDSDGYPTEESLKTIRDWPINGNQSIADLLEFVAKAWRYNFVIKEEEDGAKSWIQIATCGWSGNEDIVAELQENKIFWMSCWLESSRGGGYKFLTKPFNF